MLGKLPSYHDEAVFAELSKSAFSSPFICAASSELTMHVRSLKFTAEVNHVNRIQQLATRIIKHFHRLPYQERPQDLCLYSFARLHFCGGFERGFDVNKYFFLAPKHAIQLKRHHVS